MLELLCYINGVDPLSDFVEESSLTATGGFLFGPQCVISPQHTPDKMIS